MNDSKIVDKKTGDLINIGDKLNPHYVSVETYESMMRKRSETRIKAERLKDDIALSRELDYFSDIK